MAVGVIPPKIPTSRGMQPSILGPGRRSQISTSTLHLDVWLDEGGPVTTTPDELELGGTGTIELHVGVEVSGAVKVTVGAADGGRILAARVKISENMLLLIIYTILTPSRSNRTWDGNPCWDRWVDNRSTVGESKNDTSDCNTGICCGHRNDNGGSGIRYGSTRSNCRAGSYSPSDSGCWSWNYTNSNGTCDRRAIGVSYTHPWRCCGCKCWKS